jgi:hypothetical protein
MSKRSPEGRISFVSDKKRSYQSAAWFAKADKDGFGHRSWMRNQGLPSDVFDGRPAIGICNTWSELTPCNAHFRQIAERVKRGVWEAGGLPLEFPVMSPGESIIRPTAMLFRNLVSMDVEESIRANPIDGVVLLCLMRHRGRAVVFENIEHYKERTEDPELDVAAGGCDEGRVQTALPPARTAGEHGRGLWVAEVTQSRASHIDEMASIEPWRGSENTYIHCRGFDPNARRRSR